MGGGSLYAEHEAAYLAGIIAGNTTTANKIGFVGGIEIPPVVRFLSGFRQGVASVNSAAEVTVAWVGAFDDPTTGKELSAAAFDDGADIQEAVNTATAAIKAGEITVDPGV